jgi:type II secretory pathway pseudopilin PulG
LHIAPDVRASIRAARTAGFTLLETLIATTILVVGVASLASLSVLATRANASAKSSTFAALLATAKMEQLMALTWGYDALGHPVSDLTTDVSVFPPAAGGGTGLSASPADTLRQNTAGFCDFLDAAGGWLGGGATPPAQAVYSRRWSITPAPWNPANTLALRVVVVRADRTTDNVRLLPDEAAVAAFKARRGT